MKEINSIYIINSNGDLIFLQENLSQTSEDFHFDYLSNFLSTIETIAKEIGEKEVKVIELGNNKFFIAKDKLTKITFILKCDKTAKPKKSFELLKEIKNIFIEKFTGNFNSPQIVKRRLMKSFIEVLLEIIGKAKKVQYFLDSIKIH